MRLRDGRRLYTVSCGPNDNREGALHFTNPQVYLQHLKVSSFIDGSMLYGSDYEIEDKLREWSGGRLKVEYVDTSLDTITRIPLGLEL